MQTAGPVKVGAAFMAGIMVALGGALIYFNVTSVRNAASVRVENGRVQPSVALVASAQESHSPVENSAPHSAAIPEHTSVPEAVKASAKPQPRRTSRPVSLAVAPHPPEPVPRPATDAVLIPPSDMPAPDAALPPIIQPALQPHTVIIPAGTTLAVRLNEKLSTEHNFSGDTFRASLDAPVIMDGFIIADRGSKVLGRVIKAQKPGRGMAELSLVLTEISTTDGQRVPVETNASLRKGASSTNEEVVKMAGAAVIGAIIGAIAGGGKGAAIGAGAGGAAGSGAVLLGRGKPAVIQSETRLTFELAAATTITEHFN